MRPATDETRRPFDEVDRLAVDAVRMVCADMVEGAQSGHPGGPMSLADFDYVLWTRFLRHDPTDPAWPDRDRFVMSGGHVSTIQYTLLGLFGYLPESEWRRFRQLGSLTPGHPERGTPGIETTTGPLGQGFANAVGMAIAEQVLRQQLGAEIIDHRVFVTLGDGDVEEGVVCEAASLAGHLRLGRLVAFYDDNRVQIDGSTELTLTEDVGGRFLAQGWQVLYTDGHDRAQLAAALEAATGNTTRPTLIVGRTRMAKNTATREGDYKTHGAPLGADEIRRSKEKMGLPPDAAYFVPDAVRARFADRAGALRGLAADWRARVTARPDGEAILARLTGTPTVTLPATLPAFATDRKGQATRKANGAFLEAIAQSPEIIGGAADLGSSVGTTGFRAAGDLQARTPGGRHIYFGVREFGMGAITNGIAAHGGFVPFSATFLTFADYMKPALRLAAHMKLRAVFVFTHDSIYLGEDGPTHQPIEQLAMLRAIPGMTVMRPADANDTIACWRWAVTEAPGPVAMALTRQNLPVLERPADADVAKGAYILAGAEHESPDLVLVATGSEVTLALDAAVVLSAEGVRARVVNMVSQELFAAQPAAYRDRVLPPAALVRFALEAAATQGWDRIVGPLGDILGIDRFGESAPAEQLAEHFGFTVPAVVARAKALLAAAPTRAAALTAALAPHARRA